MTTVTPYWAEALERGRVRSNAGTETHKMGYLNLGDRVRVVEVYGLTWARFDAVEGATEVTSFDEDYNEWWTQVTLKAVGTRDPDQPDLPESIPTRPGDAELGAALRILWNFFRGWALDS